ncbi:MAG: sigma-54-dependent Fis family transcriptional regulator, partial [Phycisphaerae bacterium]|nr:sigma-54-dependent Fis family transcriptional regulator [Phycisphaerae bacterium]
FRQDLYYRINVVNIALPALRERLGDISLLAEHFLGEYVAGTNKSIRGFTPEAMELMQRHDWPGNIRELENCVERAVVLCRQNFIGPDDLPPAVLAAKASAGVNFAETAQQGLNEALAGQEKKIIQAALHANGGCRNATAEQLGINRTTLYKKMKHYGLM